MARNSYVSPVSFSYIYQVLGQIEAWRETMQAAFDERNALLPALDAPWWDNMRREPFFIGLRHKIGLPEREQEAPR
jgi:hypothetical protein